MSHNTNDGKGHPSKVAVSVADKDFGWEGIVLQEGERGHQEWDYDRYWELVLIVYCRAFFVELHLDYIVHEDEAANDEGLADFKAVQASVNINAICTENC